MTELAGRVEMSAWPTGPTCTTTAAVVGNGACLPDRVRGDLVGMGGPGTATGGI